MFSNKKAGRISGLLFLFIFISGVVIYQVLQGPVLFSDDFLTSTSTNANLIIGSVLLSILSGAADIIVAIILLPILKRQHYYVAFLYLAFCILNFIALMLDNVSVVSMLEVSNSYVANGNPDDLQALGNLFYEKHWWTHYLSLLMSCFSVFVLYYGLYISKLVPRVISIFGLFAVILMFIEILSSIYGNSISMNMMLPMGLIQLFLPFWLMFKGFNSPRLETKSQ